MRATILLIEPDPALQAALASWLEWDGHDCACVAEPDDALAHLDHDRAHVAFVADRVAGWSGSALAQAIRARHPHLAIVLMGGIGRRNDRQPPPIGMLDEIAVPVTRGAVTQAVARALAWQAAEPDERDACVRLAHEMTDGVTSMRGLCQRLPAHGRLSALIPLAEIMERSRLGAIGHGTRVADMARALGGSIHLPARALASLERAAFLHDVGQTALPDALRQASTPLTPLQAALWRRHPQIAHEILVDAPMLRDAAPLVRSAHERFDGTGYPRGLAGLEIPMGARIIAIADAFDTFTSGEDGATPQSMADASAALARGAGTRFDPDLVRLWLRLCDRLVPLPLSS